MQAKHHHHKTDILCLRHARSEFNQGEENFYSKYSQVSFQQLSKNKDYSTEVLYNPRFIDAPLSAHGIEQCKRAKGDHSLKSVKLVLVSPLRRALQTATIIFSDLKVPIVVCPEITESFRYSCDLSIPLQHKRKQFTNVDFENVKGFQAHWEITQVLSKKNQQVFNKFFENNKHKSLEQQQKLICQLVGSDQLCESDHQLRERTTKIKQLLRKYSQTYDKIAVVSHWHTLSCLNPEGNFVNAKPIWTTLEKLLLHK